MRGRDIRKAGALGHTSIDCFDVPNDNANDSHLD